VRKTLRRDAVACFFANLPRCLVGGLVLELFNHAIVERRTALQARAPNRPAARREATASRLDDDVACADSVGVCAHVHGEPPGWAQILCRCEVDPRSGE
jgi:hypothetical protein